MTTKTRPTRDHLEVAREAGLPRISLVSVLAGTLAAYGAFALVASIVGAVLNAADVSTEFRTNDWTGSGAVAGIAAAATLLVAYLFGGYVAGRMARRSGLLHGLAVAVLSLVLGAIVGGVVSALADDGAVERNLRSIGVPTSTDQVSGVAVAAVIASLAAMAIGAIVGGRLGESWHTKLARRSLDPAYGPAAEARARAEREDEARHERIDRDPLTRREAALVGARDASDEDRVRRDDPEDRHDHDHDDPDHDHDDHDQDGRRHGLFGRRHDDDDRSDREDRMAESARHQDRDEELIDLRDRRDDEDVWPDVDQTEHRSTDPRSSEREVHTAHHRPF